MEVIHERLGDYPDKIITDHFQVFMEGNRCDELTSLEQVLAVENSKKHKIQRLVIVSSAATNGARKPEHEVTVDYGVVKPPKAKASTPPSTSTAKLVTLEVRSNSPRWNRQTLSHVEEQLERTWLQQTAPVVSVLLLLLLLIIFFFVRFTRISSSRDAWSASRVMWLDDKELNRIQQAVNENRTLTEAEMREITTGQLSNVLLYQRPKPEPRQGVSRSFLFFGISIIVLGVTAIVLVVTCYPGAVFYWGDEVRHYESILQRRRVLWGILTGIVVIGVVGKFLSEGALTLFPK